MLTLGVQLECQSAHSKASCAHVVPPILETEYAWQFYAQGPVIMKTKPKSDNVISPNYSPFSEPVIIVYTFPCQSVGILFSAFLLPLAAGAVNVCLKQTFFPGHVCLSPHSGRSMCTLELCMSRCGLQIRSGSVLEGEAWAEPGTGAAFFDLRDTQRYLFPLMSLD